VLQCVAVCCSVLQCVVHIHSLYTRVREPRVLQCVAVCWSVLQCVAVCCSVLQCVEPPQSPRGEPRAARQPFYIHCNTLQHTCNTHATHCNTLQHTTTTHCNNTLQHIYYFIYSATHMQQTCNTHATRCNTLQHTTTTHCNNTLQHIHIQPALLRANGAF